MVFDSSDTCLSPIQYMRINPKNFFNRKLDQLPLHFKNTVIRCNDFDLNSYIGLLRASVLSSGFIFELPILIFFLTRIGLVTPNFLKRNRKFAIVIVLSVSAIITPPDITSQIIVTIPVLILYEISILISKLIVKKQIQKPK